MKPATLLDQLKTSTSDALPSRLVSEERNKKFTFADLFKHLGNLMPISPQDAAMAKSDLSLAGFRSQSAVAVYYGSKVILCLGMLIGGLALRGHIEKPVLKIVFRSGPRYSAGRSIRSSFRNWSSGGINDPAIFAGRARSDGDL